MPRVAERDRHDGNCDLAGDLDPDGQVFHIVDQAERRHVDKHQQDGPEVGPPQEDGDAGADEDGDPSQVWNRLLVRFPGPGNVHDLEPKRDPAQRQQGREGQRECGETRQRDAHVGAESLAKAIIKSSVSSRLVSHLNPIADSSFEVSAARRVISSNPSP